MIAVWATTRKRCQAPMAAQCAAAGRLAVQRPVRCLLTLLLAGIAPVMLMLAVQPTATPCSCLVLHPLAPLEMC